MSQDPWLYDGVPDRPARSRRSRLGMAIAGAICLVVVAVPVTLIATGASRPTASRHPAGPGGSAPQVLHALSATTASGSFDVRYTFGAQVGMPTTTTTSGSCGYPSGLASVAPGSCIRSGPTDPQPLGGTAVVDVQPFAMMATSQVPGLGTIVLRDNGTDVWEEGGGKYGLAPGSTSQGPGSTLSGFASLVEGTLGERQGALAMLGLASPTGYLNLDPAETVGAVVVGPGTVAGVLVTVYRITQSPAQGAQVPGLTSQEQQAVADAMRL